MGPDPQALPPPVRKTGMVGISSEACYRFAMTKIDDIKQAVAQLSPDELKAFRAWFEELQADLWDEQIERDAKAGKLDWLFEDAAREHEQGLSRKLP